MEPVLIRRTSSIALYIVDVFLAVSLCGDASVGYPPAVNFSAYAYPPHDCGHARGQF